MTRFHGNLLLGGAALKDLEGVFEGDDEVVQWHGRFNLDSTQSGVLQTGRTYLLLLDDGRSRKVEVVEMHEDNEQESFIVQFAATTDDHN